MLSTATAFTQLRHHQQRACARVEYVTAWALLMTRIRAHEDEAIFRLARVLEKDGLATD